MKIHSIIHAPFETPGYFERWAVVKGHEISFSHIYKGEKLPAPAEFDFLLLMGGPQSPLQLDKFPYLRDEIQLTADALAQDKLVLGVCLGAQIIAEALGARTKQSPNKEIGVFPITLTEAGKRDALLADFPESFEVAHWHNDMPGVPEGAEVLATSEGCPQQIVRFTPKAYGLQCHMEFDRACVDGLITNCPKDLAPGKYIQTAKNMLNSDFAKINGYLDLLLDRFVTL